MLRIPWSKLYRAFPELDRFSDDECERYVYQVYVQRKTLPCLLGGLICGVVWPVVCVFAIWGLRAWRLSGGALVPITVLIGEVVAIAAGLLLTRDALLIRAVRDRVDNARCTACRHSLLGLPLLPSPLGGPRGSGAEAVRCPECGAVMVLVRLGLVPDDLMPPQQPDTSTPS